MTGDRHSKKHTIERKILITGQSTLIYQLFGFELKSKCTELSIASQETGNASTFFYKVASLLNKSSHLLLWLMVYGFFPMNGDEFSVIGILLT